MKKCNKKRNDHYFNDFILINVQNNVPEKKCIAAFDLPILMILKISILVIWTNLEKHTQEFRIKF